MDLRKLARGLGWFSVGLGALEVVAPGAFEKLFGAGRSKKRRRLLRTAYGLRELAAGAGLLAGGKKSPFLAGRVLGDGLDLVSLFKLFGGSTRKKTVAFAIANVLAVTMLDAFAGTRSAAEERADLGARRVHVAQA